MIQPSLISVGDNCLDVYLNNNNMAVGGNALNVAVQWRRGGFDARYFGAVGVDAEGELIRHAVTQAGLDATDVECRDGHTAVTLLQDHAGDRRFLFEDLGVGLLYMPDAKRLTALDTADWVHLGTNSNEGLVRYLLNKGRRFSVDISTKHSGLPVKGIPLLFVSGPEDPAEPIEPLLALFRERGAMRTVITCGSRGAFYDDGATVHHSTTQPIAVVDTCGAGDSFIARFVVEHIFGGKPAVDAMSLATVAAAHTCMHEGGFPQMLAPIPDWLRDKYSSIIASAKT